MSCAVPRQPAPPGRRRTDGEPSARDRTTARPRRSGHSARVPESVAEEIEAGVGRGRAGGLRDRLGSAMRAYERDRYGEALVELRMLSRLLPGVAAVRELHGLTLYRLGRWRDAIRELDAFHALTGSFDQYPVVADCERALGRDRRVLARWEELRQAGVNREVLVEGRLVVAGMMADRGDLAGALELLGPSGKALRHPDLSHLRQWYALADCYERAGDLPRARELFARVALHDEDQLDASIRLAALR